MGAARLAVLQTARARRRRGRPHRQPSPGLPPSGGPESLSFTGSWSSTASEPDSFANTLHHTTTPGDSATFKAYYHSFGDGAQRVAWIAPRGPDRGSARVWLDGREIATVTLTARSHMPHRVVWQRRLNPWRRHTIRIEALTGRVAVDALATFGNLADP
jgi:hypothetical protein